MSERKVKAQPYNTVDLGLTLGVGGLVMFDDIKARHLFRLVNPEQFDRLEDAEDCDAAYLSSSTDCSLFFNEII